MNITVQLELDNSKINNFSELEKFAFKIAQEVGRKIAKSYLENVDQMLKETRDKKRYRSKGKRKTSIKTILGVITFEREIYADQAAPESLRHVYLLDQELEITTIGQVSEEICQYVATSICESTFRDTARQIVEMTGMSISSQGVWNVVQQMGIRQKKVVERHTELAEKDQSLGVLESKILYEENDGIWLHLQGKDRKENGKTKEMKVGITYDGVSCQKVGKKVRRTLADKIAYASFEKAKQFRKHKEGLLRSRYNTDETEVRVVNGDGARWIFGGKRNSICVLDKFHRNKMMRACIRDEEFLHLCEELLYDGRIEDLLNCIDAQRNSVEDEDEKEALGNLYRYYKDNENALTDYYSRGIAIPETRDPQLHHARLGSMESNVFTLIGNRMKGRRACWSIQGANHLAALLCAYHTIGFEHLFSSLPPKPQEEPEEEANSFLHAGQIPSRIGHGYAFPNNVSIPLGEPWLANIAKGYVSFTDMSFI